MPALSPTMEEGTLAKWLVKVGDKISSGDLIAEIETDKATMEIEAIEEGFISKLIVEEGAQGIKINTPIAEFSDTENFSEINNDKSNKNVINISNKEVIEEVKSSVIEKSDKDLTSSNNDATKKITVREALRDAILEEMEADNDVFIMGEEVAEYEGAYKVTQGLLEKFGDKRVIDTPITEHGFTGIGVGACLLYTSDAADEV